MDDFKEEITTALQEIQAKLNQKQDLEEEDFQILLLTTLLEELGHATKS